MKNAIRAIADGLLRLLNAYLAEPNKVEMALITALSDYINATAGDKD